MTGLRATAGRAGLRTTRIASFVGRYVPAFLKANAVVAWEILTPGDGLEPAVVELRLRSRSRFGIASFTALVTLTPGTLAIAAQADPPRLTVHGMRAGDPEEFRAGLHDLEVRDAGREAARGRGGQEVIGWSSSASRWW